MSADSRATSWSSLPLPAQRAMKLAIAQGMLNTVTTWLVGAQFVNFFAIDMGAQGLMIGIVQAVPNITGLLRVVAPHFINRSDNRKAVCLYAYLAARVLQIALPVMAFPQYRPPGVDPLWLLIGALCASSVCVFLGEVAWLSWFADVVPEGIWGRYFGVRNSFNQGVAMTVPLLGGLVVDRLMITHPEQKLAGYAIVYVVGIVFGLLALSPLLFVRNAPLKERRAEAPLLRELARPFHDPNFRRMAWFGAVLYLGSGITQPAFNIYLRKVLKLGLWDFAIFQNLINSVFFIIGYLWFGKLSDRYGNKAFIALGLIGAAAGPFFWLPTREGNYFVWLFAAYTVWGLGWAAVNLCQQNLMLKLAPRENNTAYIAAYQGLSGLCLGAFQIVGGLALDFCVARDVKLPFLFWTLGPYQIFFLLSFFGRSAAVFFVMRIHEPDALSVSELWRHARGRPSLVPAAVAGDGVVIEEAPPVPTVSE